MLSQNTNKLLEYRLDGNLHLFIVMYQKSRLLVEFYICDKHLGILKDSILCYVKDKSYREILKKTYCKYSDFK